MKLPTQKKYVQKNKLSSDNCMCYIIYKMLDYSVGVNIIISGIKLNLNLRSGYLEKHRVWLHLKGLLRFKEIQNKKQSAR